MGKRKKIRYIDYDYESTYEKEIEKQEESTIDRLLKSGNIKCIYATKTIQSGSQFEVEIYPEFTRKQSVKQDVQRKRHEAQKNLNDKNARIYLQRLINANFVNGDTWATLNYSRKNLPKSMDEARTNISNYMRRLNYQLKKSGLPPCRYIYITEWSEEKGIQCHHHLVIKKTLSWEIIDKVWKLGRRNHFRPLEKDAKGFTGLGDYLSKDPQGKRRWSCSLGLKKPIIRKNHQMFKMKQIREMIENRNRIRELIEKKFHGMTYIDESARYNEINGKTYIHVRLSINDEGGDRLRE